MEEQVPDWFENLDDAEIERREQSARGARFWVGLVIVLIVLGMAVVPTLNLLDLDRGSGRRETPLSATRRVGWDFGMAVLQTRSVDAAMRLAASDQRPVVEAIIGELQSMDRATLAEARVGIGVVRCADSTPIDAECFLAWLYQTGRPEFIRISYVVAGGADAPRVISVERVEPALAGR